MGETAYPIEHLVELIGTEVAYIRNHRTEGVLEGRGLLKGMGLDPEKRVFALIQDNERVGADGKPELFNCPARCVNASDDFKAAFTSLVGNVQATETEANAAVRKLVDDANARIGRMQDELLGEPLEQFA